MIAGSGLEDVPVVYADNNNQAESFFLISICSETCISRSHNDR